MVVKLAPGDIHERLINRDDHVLAIVIALRLRMGARGEAPVPLEPDRAGGHALLGKEVSQSARLDLAFIEGTGRGRKPRVSPEVPIDAVGGPCIHSVIVNEAAATTSVDLASWCLACRANDFGGEAAHKVLLCLDGLRLPLCGQLL